MATILLADNEPWLRVLARATLAPMHRLLEAWDGSQVLDLARREHPRLVLLDGAAPEMDAFAVCRQLKADPKTRDAIIVLLIPSRVDHPARPPDGADLHLVKPFGPTVLLETVSKALPAEPVVRLAAPPLQLDGLNDETEELDQALVYARELSGLYEAARDRAARSRLLVELGKDLIAARGLNAVLAPRPGTGNRLQRPRRREHPAAGQPGGTVGSARLERRRSGGPGDDDLGYGA